MNLKALIFDFDGLILDTELPQFQAWEKIYEEYGQTLPIELWIQAIGSSFDVAGFHPLTNLQTLVDEPLDNGAIILKQRAYDSRLTEAQSILPGVVALLDEADRLGMKKGVASSSPHSWVSTNLTRLGLIDRFDAIRTADDVENIKPEPDLYLAALDALGVESGEAVVFEDSANGIRAAQTAGVFAIACPNELTKYLDLSFADLVVESLADVSVETLKEHRT